MNLYGSRMTYVIGLVLAFPLTISAFSQNTRSRVLQKLASQNHLTSSVLASTTENYEEDGISPNADWIVDTERSRRKNIAFKPALLITPEGSDIAMAAAEAEAFKNGWAVTICVCDAGGVPIQVKRNSFPAAYTIATGKAKSAALFGRETGAFEDAVNVTEGESRTSLLSSPFIIMRGGVPFIVDGVICGAVGVSGVAPEQDEQIAKAGVAALEDLF